MPLANDGNTRSSKYSKIIAPDRYKIPGAGGKKHGDVRLWRDAVVTATELTGETIGLLLILAQLMNADGSHCHPGMPKLTAITGWSEDTVSRRLDDAEAAGYIERVPGTGFTGSAQEYGPTIPTSRFQLDDGEPARNPDGSVVIDRSGLDALIKIRKDELEAARAAKSKRRETRTRAGQSDGQRPAGVRVSQPRDPQNEGERPAEPARETRTGAGPPRTTYSFSGGTGKDLGYLGAGTLKGSSTNPLAVSPLRGGEPADATKKIDMSTPPPEGTRVRLLKDCSDFNVRLTGGQLGTVARNPPAWFDSDGIETRPGTGWWSVRVVYDNGAFMWTEPGDIELVDVVVRDELPPNVRELFDGRRVRHGRGLCSECETEQPLSARGNVNRHGAWPGCPGTGLPPLAQNPA